MDENREVAYTGDRIPPYHYKFPHTCGSACKAPNVCHHHKCDYHCYANATKGCIDFICPSCCPGSTITAALPPATGDASQLLLHAKMYEVADKYDVTGLDQLAREKFLRAATEFWDTEHFAPAAHYAFSTTPEEDKGLRDVVSNIISQHMALLKKPAVESLLIEFNGLAVGLLKARAKDLGWE